MEETQRLDFLELAREKFVKGYFPTFFDDTISLREKSNTWHERSVSWDVFQVISSKDSKTGQQSAMILCTVPPPKVFWDVWLAMYYLENPKVFPSVSHVARTLLNYLTEVKINLETGFQGFEAFHLDYLVKTATGDPKVTNSFLQDPTEALFLIRSCVHLASLTGDQDQDPFLLMEKGPVREKLQQIRDMTNKEMEDFYSRKSLKETHGKGGNGDEYECCGNFSCPDSLIGHVKPDPVQLPVSGSQRDGSEERPCPDPPLVIPGPEQDVPVQPRSLSYKLVEDPAFECDCTMFGASSCPRHVKGGQEEERILGAPTIPKPQNKCYETADDVVPNPNPVRAKTQTSHVPELPPNQRGEDGFWLRSSSTFLGDHWDSDEETPDIHHLGNIFG